MPGTWTPVAGDPSLLDRIEALEKRVAQLEAERAASPDVAFQRRVRNMKLVAGEFE